MKVSSRTQGGKMQQCCPAKQYRWCTEKALLHVQQIRLSVALKLVRRLRMAHLDLALQRGSRRGKRLLEDLWDLTYAQYPTQQRNAVRLPFISNWEVLITLSRWKPTNKSAKQTFKMFWWKIEVVALCSDVRATCNGHHQVGRPDNRVSQDYAFPHGGNWWVLQMKHSVSICCSWVCFPIWLSCKNLASTISVGQQKGVLLPSQYAWPILPQATIAVLAGLYLACSLNFWQDCLHTAQGLAKS